MAKDPEQFRIAETAFWQSVCVEPTEEWVTLSHGENIRVQIVGDGPPILFIHGGSSSGANWAPLIAGMQDFRCIAIDRPGCGLSDPAAGGRKPADMGEVEDFADRLVADVLDGLAIERAHVLSTSYGGYFAMRGAAAHPNRVDRIVEMTWMMGAPIGYAPMSMRLAAIPGLGALMTKIPPTRFSIKMILKQIGLKRALESGRVSNELMDWFLALLRHTNTMANELKANPHVITPIRGISPKMLLTDDLIGKIKAPVLFIWGGEDPMGGETVARPFAAKFDNATVEMLPLAGHAPWIDEPDRCARIASEFLGA